MRLGALSFTVLKKRKFRFRVVLGRKLNLLTTIWERSQTVTDTITKTTKRVKICLKLVVVGPKW